MPPDDRLWLDNGDRVQHRGKQSLEPHEEQAIDYRQFGLRRNAPAQHVQLMPQQDDLGFQPCLRLEWRDQDVEKQIQKRDQWRSA